MLSWDGSVCVCVCVCANSFMCVFSSSSTEFIQGASFARHLHLKRFATMMWLNQNVLGDLVCISIWLQIFQALALGSTWIQNKVRQLQHCINEAFLLQCVQDVLNKSRFFICCLCLHHHFSSSQSPFSRDFLPVSPHAAAANVTSYIICR